MGAVIRGRHRQKDLVDALKRGDQKLGQFVAALAMLDQQRSVTVCITLSGLQNLQRDASGIASTMVESHAV